METSLKIIQQLVADFKANEKAFLSPNYQESQVRQDFIDKFFTALGWDVTHTVQKNPYEQEVKIENKVTTQGSQRRADYAFFITPNYRDVKFFAEAKKPAHNLANADYYHQTIRYGWNVGTPIAVLTDFEEFHILDCRYKPNISDSLSRKIKYFHFTEYADEEKFKEIFYLFGREAVADGSLEKFAAKLPKPKGKTLRGFRTLEGLKSVDEDFLEVLDEYRNVLAKAFKKENQEFDGEELTEAVQRTLDRLVFIRFLEDKGIEEPSIIALYEKKSAWKSFIELCKRLEPKYNGLIFKPHRILDGKEFNPPDDKAFADICVELADPSSPYDFDKIPISILGSIYERFLGKVVHATAKQARVEEKPEVRKAGGVYYTPEYIVRYIVSETVGKLLNEKTPDEITKMSFADIACGSGSFLIEVYSQLLDYHERWYNANRKIVKEGETYERDGQLHISLKKKKEILLNNIYGVDIDFQATEVTQLSLYLKLLENVTNFETHQLGLFKEQILPNLAQNIVCGNSLVGTDIYDGDLFESVRHAELVSASKKKKDADIRQHDEDKLKPMNFEDVFPAIIKKGGFDAIVGNPPYVFGRDWKSLGITESVKKYFTSNYTWSPYQLDMFSLFMERAFVATKFSGRIGQIVPNVWLNNTYSKITRSSLLKNADSLIIAVPPGDVFKGITVDTVVYTYWKQKIFGEKFEMRIINPQSVGEKIEFETKTYFDGERPISFSTNSKALEIVYKLKNKNSPLSEFAEITRGVHPYRVGGYGKSAFSKGSQIQKDVDERPYHSKTFKNGFRPFIYGKDLKYFSPVIANEYVKYGTWLAEPRQSKFFEGERIYSRKILGDRLVVTVANDNNVADQQVYITKPIKEFYSVFYLASIMGSKLISFFIRQYYNETNDAFPQIKVSQLQSLPIRTINFDDAKDKSRHDAIVKLVEQMLDAKQKIASAKTDSEVSRLELLCESLDRKIDEAVYELYGLTEEEVKIVEGK